MTIAVDQPVAPDLHESSGSTPIDRRLVTHWAFYLAVLLVYVATIDFGGSITSDDGAYGWQIHALADDTWPLERTLPVVAADNEGILNARLGPEGPWPYARHPGYVLAQRSIADHLGLIGGAYALPLLALAVFPLAISALAMSLERAWSVPALWLAAASPLAINGTGAWPHAPAAVLATLSLWAAIGLIKRPSWGFGALLWLSLIGGVFLRTESALWAGAITLSIVLVARDLPRVLYAASGLFVAAIATVVERVAIADLLANSLPKVTPSDAEEIPSYFAGRIPAGWHELFAGSLVGGLVGLPALIGMISILVGAYRFRHNRVDEAKVLFGIGIALYVLRIPLVGTDLISGIVTAWPAGFVLLIAAPISARPALRVTLIAGTIFTLSVLTAQASASGDGWGGRYLSSLIPVLCLLGAAAYSKLDQTPVLRSIAVAILIAPLASGVIGAHNRRSLHAESIDYVLQVETDVVVAEEPALPRLAWTAADSAEWYRSTPNALSPLLVQLASADVERITVQGFRDQPITLEGYDVIEVDNGLRQLVAQ